MNREARIKIVVYSGDSLLTRQIIDIPSARFSQYTNNNDCIELVFEHVPVPKRPGTPRESES